MGIPVTGGSLHRPCARCFPFQFAVQAVHHRIEDGFKGFFVFGELVFGFEFNNQIFGVLIRTGIASNFEFQIAFGLFKARNRTKFNALEDMPPVWGLDGCGEIPVLSQAESGFFKIRNHATCAKERQNAAFVGGAGVFAVLFDQSFERFTGFEFGH